MEVRACLLAREPHRPVVAAVEQRPSVVVRQQRVRGVDPPEPLRGVWIHVGVGGARELSVRQLYLGERRVGLHAQGDVR